jgi:hypothetical protein
MHGHMNVKKIQKYGNLPTCFGLFWPSSKRYSTKKNTTMAIYAIDVKTVTYKGEIITRAS